MHFVYAVLLLIHCMSSHSDTHVLCAWAFLKGGGEYEPAHAFIINAYFKPEPSQSGKRGGGRTSQGISEGVRLWELEPEPMGGALRAGARAKWGRL